MDIQNFNKNNLNQVKPPHRISSQNLENNNNEAQSGFNAIDIKNYKGLEGVSTKKLDLNLWLVRNYKFFYNFLVTILIIICLALWIYSAYSFFNYYTIGKTQYNKLENELSSSINTNHEYLKNNSAKKLISSKVFVIKTATDKYDFLAEITNPNKDFFANLEYCFITNGVKTDCSSNFILPNSTKNIFVFNKEFKINPINTYFTIKQTSWKRIDKHKYPNWDEFQNKHLNFSTSDIKFTPGSVNEISNKIKIQNLKFNIKNNTAYNYLDINLNIVMYNNNTILGIHKYLLKDFMSSQKRFVELNWIGNINRITKTIIEPELNIINEDIYIKFKEGIGDFK